ncbi:hypothetical protein [Caldilinea sp.]|uniref:hypothetical protein n=1 Tax=Caldilinea sp. TaxID=2293560 RepID=UPI002CB2D8B5|nr:hypothetical protein [Caldilinea sp.]HRA68059.1 hypothetical protein [Caldilinea sp.]
MNPEQRSTGPLQIQTDPDSSKPDAEPGQRTLTKQLLGHAAVETLGGGAIHRQQINLNRRFARPVFHQRDLAGGGNSLRSNHDRVWRFAF